MQRNCLSQKMSRLQTLNNLPPEELLDGETTVCRLWYITSPVVPHFGSNVTLERWTLSQLLTLVVAMSVLCVW